MAYQNEGGSSRLGSGLGSAVSGIGRAVSGAASQKKKGKSTGSGASKGVRGVSNAVRNVGRQTSNSARNRSGSGRSGSSGRSGGGRPATTPRISTPRPPVGNTPGGQIARSVPQAPPPISVEQYLAGDTAYGSQKNAYQKALADYAAQFGAEQSKYNGEYDAQTKQLGLDRTEGLANLQDDYAGRGLIQSGVYADAQGDLNKKFDTSAADMERARQAYLDDLMTGKTNFETTQKTLLEKARQDALNRRIDSLGR